MNENNFESMFAKITSNPELMSKISEVVKNNKGGEISDTLPGVLSLIEPEINKGDEQQNASSESDSQGSLGAIGEISKQISKSTPLLLAIKPYLNKSRQDLVENLVKLSSLASVLNLAGLDLGKQA